MNDVFHRLKRVLFITYLVALHLVVLYFVGERILGMGLFFSTPDTGRVTVPTIETPLPTPLSISPGLADLSAVSNNSTVQTAPSPTYSVGHGELLVPVVGVKREQLIDTFSDSRTEGRFHDAIDIPAAAGTPVIAAADGQIIKFWESEAGGITIYQLSADKQFVYYYAHLQRRADEIKEGEFVRKGATIAFVGDTGNAGAGNYHLHFSIARVTDPKRYWEGTYINPYTLLRNAESPR